MRLYHHDSQQLFTGYECDMDSWKLIGTILGPTPSSMPLAALQWNAGNKITFYYQSRTGDIMEHWNDGRGWFAGSTVRRSS
jgi:hypothetical protein